MSIAGIVKDVVLVITSSFLFSNPISLQQYGFYALSIFGVFLHRTYKSGNIQQLSSWISTCRDMFSLDIMLESEYKGVVASSNSSNSNISNSGEEANGLLSNSKTSNNNSSSGSSGVSEVSMVDLEVRLNRESKGSSSSGIINRISSSNRDNNEFDFESQEREVLLKKEGIIRL